MKETAPYLLVPYWEGLKCGANINQYIYSYYIGLFSPYGHVNEAEFFMRVFFMKQNNIFLMHLPPKCARGREKSAVEATI